MTAINACVLPGGEAAVILTDTVAYVDDGLIYNFEAKTKTLPHKVMAVATRGGSEVLAWAADWADRCEDIDYLVSCDSEPMMQEWKQHLLVSQWQSEMDVVVIGWSTAQQSMIVAQARSDGDNPFKFETGEVVVAPNVSPEQLVRAGLGNAAGLDLGPDPIQGLLKIMEIQRSEAAEYSPRHKRKAHVIGGQAVATLVRQKRTIQQVIHRWPDKVGQRVNLGAA